jgi:hypothetical protein
MTYRMTNEYQKILTKMIGEKLHEIISEQPYEVDTVIVGSLYRCSCGYDFHSNVINKHFIVANRTFTDDSDMMKVFRWLVDGKWEDFYKYIVPVYKKDNNIGYYTIVFGVTIFAWLFYDAERFCCLVAEAKKEGVI